LVLLAGESCKNYLFRSNKKNKKKDLKKHALYINNAKCHQIILALIRESLTIFAFHYAQETNLLKKYILTICMGNLSTIKNIKIK